MKTSNKKALLGRLKEANRLTSDTELANLLGINKSTLSNWYSRDTLDYDLVFSKCESINLDWLLTGQGEMLRQLGQVAAPAAKAVEPPPQPPLEGAIAIYKEMVAEKDRQIQELNREVGRLEGEVRALREVLVQRAGGGAPNAGEQGSDRAAS